MVAKVLSKIFPLIKWGRNYSTEFAVYDFIAGITVALTVLPQSLAYAALAGLEPQYGLYSAFIGGIVYALFGSCRELTIGPNALLSLMTSRHTSLGGASGPHLANLLCLCAGIVEMLMAFLKLGAIVDFISLPVTVGFTSATAIIICLSQLKGLLGISGRSSSGFFATIHSIITNLDQIRVGDVSLGVSAIIILLLLRKLKDIKTPENASKPRHIFGVILWLVSTSRNALIVVGASFIAFYCEQIGQIPFVLTGTVRSGLPSIALPAMHTTMSAAGVNGTDAVVIDVGLTGMLSELGPSIALVPIIAVLGNAAIAKAFGGAGINPTKEIVALSLCNIFGSFVSSFPVTGSFSRSAVNHATGVKTPIGGIYTSVIVLAALSILTPYFRFIPKAALSAVIISAVIFMIEYEVVRPLWRCSRRELLPGAITFIACLSVGVELGLLAGVATDLAFLIQRAARPTLSVEKITLNCGLHYVHIRPRYSLLYFPAIEWVRHGISKAMKEHGALPIVLDCRHLNEFDFTVARGLGDLHKEMCSMNISLVLLGPQPAVKKVLSEASNTTIPHVPNESDLETLLQDLISESQKLELVVMPLLNGGDIESGNANFQR